jgi:hypothetical protein
MATRIESGQIQLSQPGNVPMVQAQMPTVQPIGFQVAAQEQGRMAQLIQRMSESLFREAGQMAEQEGFRYAAENPLTDEEIALARDGAITKPTGRIFDDAFRKARTMQLASHFEAEGMTNMSRLLPDIEAGRLTSEQVILKLREMNSGFTSSLAKLDPAAALKFNASMAASGNTIVRKALETEIRQDRERNRIKFDMYFNDVAKILQDTIEQNPEQANQLIDMHGANISRAALTLGDANMQQEYTAKFRTQARDAKINVLTKYLTSDQAFLDSPTKVLSWIRMGNIGGRLDPVLKDLQTNDFDAVAKVQANFLTAVAQKNQTEELSRKERDRAAVAEATPLWSAAMTLPEDSPSRRQVLDRLTEIATANPNAIPLSMLSSLAKPPQEENQAVEFNMRLMIDNNTITAPEQIWQMVAPGSISPKQAITLLGYMNSSDRRQASERERVISEIAGVPMVPGQPVVLDPKSEEWKRRILINQQAQVFEQEAAAEGKTLMPMQLRDQLNTWLTSKRNTSEIEAIKKRLQPFEAKAGGAITPDSITTVEKSGKLDSSDMLTVRRLVEQLRQAEMLR